MGNLEGETFHANLVHDEALETVKKGLRKEDCTQNVSPFSHCT